MAFITDAFRVFSDVETEFLYIKEFESHLEKQQQVKAVNFLMSSHYVSAQSTNTKTK
jgi:hypothetical protein